MPQREVIALSDPCVLASTWRVDQSIMSRVFRAAELFEMTTRRPVWIISGWRSQFEQRQLKARGRPTASDDTSTHRTCPATGLDVSLGSMPGRDLIAFWGSLVQLNGLRWGGGSSVDADGIPSDWQHLDGGPRA